MLLRIHSNDNEFLQFNADFPQYTKFDLYVLVLRRKELSSNINVRSTNPGTQKPGNFRIIKMNFLKSESLNIFMSLNT